jgi:hypothetical protein
MVYFLLGLAALLIGLVLLRGVARADVAALARGFRIAGGTVALGGSALLVFRGYLHYAVPLAMLGFWLLSRGAGPSWGGFPGGQPSTGQTTRVVTDHLEMELDHDTGELNGSVLKGTFAGRRVESMTPAEMAALWRDCRFADPQSASLIEAYLDRAYPDWREDMARGGGAGAGRAGAGQGMTRQEAYEILGLEPGAGAEQIRRAHRELMLKIHPDRGGSDYLAAKINEAKDVLLGR